MQQLAPAPRASLQTALSSPQYYLPSAGRVTEQSGLDGNMPDVCIAYQLHLECGRLINLYDWLQVYSSMQACFALYNNSCNIQMCMVASAKRVYLHGTGIFLTLIRLTKLISSLHIQVLIIEGKSLP